VTNHDQMQELLDNFFSDLLGTEIQRPFTLNLLNFHRDPVDLSDLESPFSEREVQDTIASLPNDKAPGPDYGCAGLSSFWKCSQFGAAEFCIYCAYPQKNGCLVSQGFSAY
jgi:hypothetical protein